MKKKSGIGPILIIALILILLLSMCSGGHSHTSSYTSECRSCGRTFKAGDSAGNYKNIARTGMCNNCYNNFKWAQNALGR